MGVIRHLPNQPESLGQMDGFILAAQFELQDCAVRPERVYVQLKILTSEEKIGAGFLNGAAGVRRPLKAVNGTVICKAFRIWRPSSMRVCV